MNVQISKKWRAIVTRTSFIFSLMILAGCVSITKPQNNYQSPTGDVDAEVGFRSRVCGNFMAMLDGNDVTQKFTPQPPAATLPQAKFTGLSPGSHTLTISADMTQLFSSNCANSSATVSFSVAGLSLSFSPVGPQTIDAGGTTNVSVTTSAAQTAPIAVNLTKAPNTNVVTLPTSTTIPANATSSSQLTISGQVSGNTTITADANGFQSGSITINVRPVLASLNPVRGTSGTGVVVNGSGFDQSASVNFGNQAAPTRFLSSSQLTTTVPANLNGAQSVTVVSAGQNSRSLTFTVTAPPTSSPSPVVFRASDKDMQAFNFTTSGSPILINSQNATLSSGSLVVGLSFNGSVLVRSSSSDVQTFSVNSAGQLSSGTATAATLSPVGVSVVTLNNQVVRTSASDIQIFSLSGTSLSLQGSAMATPSSAGADVDLALIGGRTLAVRGYSAGVEVFDITNPTAITSRGNNNIGGLSSVGVGLRVIGNRGLRVFSGGIELYDLTTTTPLRIAFNNTGGLSSTGVAVTSNTALTRIIRATDAGIEVYQASGTSLAKLGAKNGALSATGVAVAMVGNRVFRAWSSGVEEYDITDPANVVLIGSIPATLTSTGVGIAVR